VGGGPLGGLPRRDARAGQPELGLDGLGDAVAERLGHLVDAAVADHQPELGLEVERLQARRAVVEVLLDVDAVVRVGQLAVEVQVQLLGGSRCSSAIGGLGGQRSVRRHGRGGVGRAVGEPVVDGVVEQPLLQRLSSPVQPAHHRADRDVEDLGDLLVREPSDVGEQDGHAEDLRQVLDRLLHLGVAEGVHQLVLGAAAEGPPRGRRGAVEVEVLDLVELGLSGRRCLAR
jgi:hypothetical protein